MVCCGLFWEGCFLIADDVDGIEVAFCQFGPQALVRPRKEIRQEQDMHTGLRTLAQVVRDLHSGTVRRYNP